MTPRVFVPWCAALLFAAGWPALARESAPGTDLAGVLAHARAHHPGFAAERLEAAAAQAGAQAAGALPDPRFTLELMDVNNAMNGRERFSALPGEVGETRYRIEQMLPWPGKRALEAQSATARADARGATVEAEWRELAGTLKNAWLRYWAAHREQALYREQLDLAEALEDAALARYRSGAGDQQAVLRAQGERTELRIALTLAEQKLAGASAALNGLLDRPADAALAAPGEAPPLPARVDHAALFERLSATHPALAAQARQIDAATAERERARLERYPDFGVGLTYNRPRGGTESWDLMLEVNIPLQRAPRQAREREAAYLREAAEARLGAEQARLRGALGAAVATLRGAAERETLTTRTLLPQRDAAFEATRAAYAAGRADFDAVLEAWRRAREGRLAALEAGVEARMALFELQTLAGEEL
ncbi:TolC family protein [Pseudothauera nasutitermitis]|uniref:TolC family protein n=1 Tax=Pseudothauera nasutitermitis TaxID=2565930 RepID=A0A4S4ARM1_9RHOO|nr:TolC family protein [Pseudothauera nasutitermitis]THF61139.1 TolC family protein [Pseudothauera nasutitermitis]